MLHLADARPPVRQSLAVGRLSERITGRGLAATSATLSLRVGAGPWRPLATRFQARTEGYFAFDLVPDRDMPDVAAAPAVTLRAEFLRRSAAPLASERTVAGSVLALADQTRSVAGGTVTVRTVAGAPVDLSFEADPAPVALQGIVLRDHDPAEPIAGVEIATGGSQAVSDAAGRFFLPALPLLAEVTLALTENATTTNHAFRIDYAQPVNTVTLSLPG